MIIDGFRFLRSLCKPDHLLRNPQDLQDISNHGPKYSTANLPLHGIAS